MSDEQKPTNRKPLATFPRPTKKYRSEPYDRISLANSGFDGTGKTVFITGGATGVGYAIAHAFAKAGARRIILVSRTVRSLENAKKSLSAQYPSLECLVFAASLTDYQKITDIVQQINDIDVLVHSAVMVNEPIPVEQIPVSTAQELFVTNVFGALNLFTAYCNCEFRGPKTIINVSSAAAGVLIPLNSLYGASKAATAQILQHMAAEQQAKPVGERVRIFSFHPGHFYTPLVAQHVDKTWVDWDDIELAGDYAVWLAGSNSAFLEGRFTWATWDMDELLALKAQIEQDPSYLTIGLKF
ncbi:hypothetical protein FOVG_19248 [Fusarium oxysporum f. sp. pisi HDV247]|uniref:Ketoreductase domain-containing protein n=1 Tax=Fusarium oxysporum f. sp. pisi HDV247 TaxID=1080344 RepID=W9N9C0_FUSOX|nr:hypothetical protein FOVG_19248 [Fusarium oxysporum f. sp. pisi HDV247]